MTGHPDHIAVSEWTTRAVARAANGADLLYATHTPEWADRFEALAHEHNVMMGAETLPVTPLDQLVVDVRLAGDLLELKEQAMLAQASQVALLRDAIGDRGHTGARLRERNVWPQPGD